MTYKVPVNLLKNIILNKQAHIRKQLCLTKKLAGAWCKETGRWISAASMNPLLTYLPIWLLKKKKEKIKASTGHPQFHIHEMFGFALNTTQPLRSVGKMVTFLFRAAAPGILPGLWLKPCLKNASRLRSRFYKCEAFKQTQRLSRPKIFLTIGKAINLSSCWVIGVFYAWPT